MKQLNSFLILLITMMLTVSAQAAQVIANAEKEPVTVAISMREQNSVSVQGRRLQRVIPPRQGVFSTFIDKSSGILYFTLTQPGPDEISVFVIDEKGGRYRLILAPRHVMAQDIVIVPTNAPVAEATDAPPASGPSQSIHPTGNGSNAPMARTAIREELPSALQAEPVTLRTSSLQRRIKELMVAMSTPGGLAKTQTTQLNKVVPLWREGTLTYVERIPDNDFIGEIYQLTNTTANDITLVEQELARQDVLAISIAQHTVPPGQSTAIYIIRQRAPHER